MNLIAIIFVFCIFTTLSQCANILGLFPMPIKSHYIVFDALMMELVKRGHNVTLVNTFPKSNQITNLTEIDISSLIELPDVMSLDPSYVFHNPFKQIPLLTSYGNSFKSIIEYDPVKNMELSHYDLIITEIFNGDIMLGFAEKSKKPFVLFCAGPVYPWATERTGNPDNPAFIPYVHSHGDFDRWNPTFFQRLYNTFLYVMAKGYYYYYSFEGNQIAKKAFGADLPPLSEIAKNTSLILTFSHFSINSPLPLVPNIVEVAGLQIKHAEALPKMRVLAKAVNKWKHSKHLHLLLVPQNSTTISCASAGKT